MIAGSWETPPGLLVQASFGVGTAIPTEASLSFLGLGEPPPTVSWGRMPREGCSYLLLAPWISVASGAAIFVVVLGLQLLADGLQDVFAGRAGGVQPRGTVGRGLGRTLGLRPFLSRLQDRRVVGHAVPPAGEQHGGRSK